MQHFLNLHVQVFENINVNAVTSKQDQRFAHTYSGFCFAYANPHTKPSGVYPVAYEIRALHNSSPQGLTSGTVLQKPARHLLKLRDRCRNIFLSFRLLLPCLIHPSTT